MIILLPIIIWSLDCLASFLLRPYAREIYAGSNLSSLNCNPLWIATGFIFLALAMSSGLSLRGHLQRKVWLYFHIYGLSLFAVVYGIFTMLDMIADPL